MHRHYGRAFLLIGCVRHSRRVGKHVARSLEVHAVVGGNELWNVLPHIVHFSQGFKQGDQLEEAPIFGVVIPGEYGYCIFLVKSVACRRIVYNEGVLHRATEQRHIFHVDSLDRGAVLAKEAGVYESPGVQDVH